MSNSRLEWKVGLFLLVALCLAAALIMKFSKSASWFTPTYEIRVVTSNVGGIRPGATVLMAGVQVGTVRSIDLAPSGSQVIMHVDIEARYQVRQNARFTIEQAGFLGDQYIAIAPGTGPAPELRPGETVHSEEPFNFQEVARSAAGLLRRVDQTAARLDAAVGRIDETILAERTLTNLSETVGNFRVVSERALTMLKGVGELVQTNASPLSTAISNLVQFSEQLDEVAVELQQTITTNRMDINAAVRNIESGTAHLNEILADIQAGKGLAGSILKDEALQQQFSQTVSNLSIVSRNLSEHGLLWRPRPRLELPSTPYTGKLPGR
jgi:phospholipid/cholesterol/gamma-HCH transport system substrate-binding protein